MSDEARTLRDRLIDAADGSEQTVDRLRAKQVRGSAQIEGIDTPKCRCPVWQAYEEKWG